MEYIYGPVPSRRLGLSLGVDIIPYKTCSFDCVYCQLGATTNKTVERKEYLPKDEILMTIEKAISSGKKIDYITFSGSGEPTLNSKIGCLIQEIKRITNIPVAVLTNSSLLYDEQVREELLPANLVVPTYDAANEDIFETIHHPHPAISIEKITTGLKEFSKKFKGSLWIEVMLVKDKNDAIEHIEALKSVIKDINPDKRCDLKVQLNTVVRPPTDELANPLSYEELDKIRELIGGNCEIIAKFNKKQKDRNPKNIEESIRALVSRRPVTLADISNSLGICMNEMIKYLHLMEQEKKIKSVKYNETTFYENVM